MDSKGVSEDWLSVWIGLLLFVLSLAVMGGADLLGWVVTTQVWTDASKALGTVSKRYAGLGGVGALIVTYLALLIVLTAGAAALTRLDTDRAQHAAVKGAVICRVRQHSKPVTACFWSIRRTTSARVGPWR